MDIKTYLQRIDFQNPVKPDVQTLHELQHCHMLHVPFENLDIGLKRPICLNTDSLWSKIVLNRRGGFCYELNGLFAELLRAIGFHVTYLNARVFNRQGQLGIDFDHLALFVRVPDDPTRWLVDVGFGDSFQLPLKIDETGEQLQGLRAYRLEKTSDGYITWQKNYDGTWERHYFFDLQPHSFPEEYETACLYHQTSPQSSFTHNSIISRATPEGRISLEDGRLILTTHGKRTVRPLENDAEYHKLLREHFGLSLPTELI